MNARLKNLQSISLFSVASVAAHCAVIFFLALILADRKIVDHNNTSSYSAEPLQISIQRALPKKAEPKPELNPLRAQAKKTLVEKVTSTKNTATETDRTINTSAKPTTQADVFSLGELRAGDLLLSDQAIHWLSHTSKAGTTHSVTDGHDETRDSVVKKSNVENALRLALSQSFQYPIIARRKGWQGLVELGIRVESSGLLSNIHVIKTSGYRLLDYAAIETLYKIHRLDGAEAWLNGGTFDTVLPVEYKLTDG